MKATHSSPDTNTRSPASGETGIGQRRFALDSIIKLLGCAAVFLVASLFPARASDPVGIYAFVDRVALEPNDTAPERIQVWGGFALAEGRDYNYTPARRGYMYFKLRQDKETLCRNEWADLKSVAGTGKIVAFGRRHTNNGTVRNADAKPENPDAYPVGFGMQKISMRDYKPLNELNALKSEKSSEKKGK